jgi:hypothetical protein
MDLRDLGRWMGGLLLALAVGASIWKMVKKGRK